MTIEFLHRIWETAQLKRSLRWDNAKIDLIVASALLWQAIKRNALQKSNDIYINKMICDKSLQVFWITDYVTYELAKVGD